MIAEADDMLSVEQRRLARHALGLPSRATKGRSYRNRYALTPGGALEAEWRLMVAADLAFQGQFQDGDTLLFFHLTRRGAEAALDKGETLDAEDFPAGAEVS